MTINILYLHGFNSSPQSVKSKQTKAYINEHFPAINFYCPQLASSPQKVIEQLTELIEKQGGKKHTWYFMGSSLGGYFATYFAEKFQAKAVLVNPAIKPYLLMHDYIGEHKNPYTQEVYQVEQSHIETLIAIEKIKISAKNYLIMVQTGDEVLNYQDAIKKHHASSLVIQQGGDHSFVNFERMLPRIALFLSLE